MRAHSAHTLSTAPTTAQLWPCQRQCSRTPAARLPVVLPHASIPAAAPSAVGITCNAAAAVASSCMSGNNSSRSGRSRCRQSVIAAASAQPPSSTSKDEQQQDSNNDESSRQQEQASRSNSRSATSKGTDGSRSSSSSSWSGSPFSIDDPQLLVGDCVALTAAALYRQIAAIVLSPSFAGWFAPLSFNPLRFAEFANFAGMLVASWVVAATLTGGYSGAAVGAGVPNALRAVCKAWLVAMPICAAHLVPVTASESQALVTDNGFADVLPLAAAGPGEPLGTAAAVLGLMAMWRSFYAVYLDTWVWASARDVAEDAARFREALASVALVAAGCSILLQVLQLSTTLSGAAADGVDVGQMLLSSIIA